MSTTSLTFDTGLLQLRELQARYQQTIDQKAKAVARLHEGREDILAEMRSLSNDADRVREAMSELMDELNTLGHEEPSEPIAIHSRVSLMDPGF